MPLMSLIVIEKQESAQTDIQVILLAADNVYPYLKD